MNLSEDEIDEKYSQNCGYCLRILYYHTNMNLLAYQVDET